MDKNGFAKEIFKSAKGELTIDQATRIADRTVSEMEAEAAKSPDKSIDKERFEKILGDNVIVERYGTIIAKTMLTPLPPQSQESPTKAQEPTTGLPPYRIPIFSHIENREIQRKNRVLSE